MINTIAGDGTAAYSGDLGPATAAEINTPYGVAADAAGNVYFTDYGNNRIRKIDTGGIIKTIAGTGVGGFSGDGGAATAAKINAPRGIAVDAAGNVYFSDYGNNRIRKINTSGVITTIAGNGLAGFSGDGGPAASASLNFPWGVAVDGTGNIYIADQSNCRVRKINSSGTISTIAGTGSCFIGGDGGPAVSALVQYPLGVACDGSGNVYIADYGNNRIRKINSSGIISTIAGSPTYGFAGDGGPSTASKLYYPEGIAADAAGNVYICDVNNNRIRMINSSGIINTLTGTGVAAYSGDGGPPFFAEINRSTGVAIGVGGKIYISDNENHRIRVIQIPTHAPYFVHGHSFDTAFCPIESIGLDSVLAAFDVDAGQTEIWSLISGPYNGTVMGADTVISTGGVVYPSGTNYAASPGYIGTDSFKIRISDGGLADTITVHITVLHTPDPGTIVGADTLCPGDTVTFTDTVAGGTWSSYNPAVASVSPAGLVTGVSAGITLISYAVTNTCGTVWVSFPIRISSECPVSVHETPPAKTERIIVYPNPAKEKLTITASSYKDEDVRFVITDMMGKKVFTLTARTNEQVAIQPGVPPGVYFISAATDHNLSVSKIIIEK